MPRITEYQHFAALRACAEVRQAFPDLPDSVDVGTAEYEAHQMLTALNEMAGAHACNEPMSHARYEAAVRAMAKAQTFGPRAGQPPAFTAEDQLQTHGRVACTLASGKMFAVVPHEGGYLRGGNFGRTVEEAMIGAGD